MAASRIARGKPPTEITLIDARPTFTQRIRLHETLAGRKPATFDYAPLLGRRGVRFVFKPPPSCWPRSSAILKGRTGLLNLVDGKVLSAMTFQVEDGKIHGIYAVVNPDKLERITPL